MIERQVRILLSRGRSAVYASSSSFSGSSQRGDIEWKSLERRRRNWLAGGLFGIAAVGVIWNNER